MSKELKEFEEKVEQLKKRTAFDEDTIGCFLCNFHDRYVCGRFRNSGCTSLVKCQRLLYEQENIRLNEEEVLTS